LLGEVPGWLADNYSEQIADVAREPICPQRSSAADDLNPAAPQLPIAHQPNRHPDSIQAAFASVKREDRQGSSRS
jgi:hypothetical protein